MRLIDADKLEKDLMDMAHNELMPDYSRQMCMAMAERVSKEPTIEAEPVRHGRWIENATYEDGTKSYICDCCYADESWLDRLICRKEPCCPNCGAKMDSKEVAENVP